MVNNITYRNARLQDLPQISEVDRNAFGSMSYPLFVLRQFLDITQDYFLVACIRNKVVGYTIGHVDLQKQEAWILSLAVVTDFQQKGIGSQLTANVLSAIENDFKGAIYLTVSPQNHSATTIYQKLGFKESKWEANYYGDNEERIIMKRENVYR